MVTPKRSQIPTGIWVLGFVSLLMDISSEMIHSLLPLVLVTLLGASALIVADLILASSAHWAEVLAGVAVWGVHMGMTQGLMAVMVADTAPADLRGTAYRSFNLVSCVAPVIASLVAGLLWDSRGAPATFLTGAAFSAAALGLLVKRGGNRPAARGV